MARATHPTADPSPTRDRVLARLRRGACSVDEIARTVGTTRNAVRSHLSALERDGLVRNAGVRRARGAGKPATLYALTAEAQLQFSRAYPAALSALVQSVLSSLDKPRAESLLRNAGMQMAEMMGGEASGTLAHRVQAAAQALRQLGGEVEIEKDGHALMIKGFGCPLAQAVSKNPETCRAVRAMVHGVSGARTEERCEHGAEPRCRFRVGADS